MFMTWNRRHSQTALRKLDAMIGMWGSAKHVNIGWPFSSDPENADLDTETNAPDVANEAIYLNLAIRIAPGFGKVVQPETTKNANIAFKSLLSYLAHPSEMQFPGTTPAGQGNKPWRETYRPFLNKPNESPLRNTANNNLKFKK